MIDTYGSPPTNGANATQPLLLEMRAITKSFPGVQALREVDFDVRKGEVHALVGESYLDGKLWTEPVAGLPEIDNDLPTVPD